MVIARRILLVAACLLGVFALASPNGDLRGRILSASLRPPLDGVDAKTGQRIPHAPPVAGETRTMTIKALGNFAYDPVAETGVPADVRALDGMRVRLRGYMRAMDQANGRLTTFALVPSLFSCCYGQPPGIQHTVIVHCSPEVGASFSSGPVDVEGRLSVREVRDDGYVIGLFQLTGSSVTPLRTADQ